MQEGKKELPQKSPSTKEPGARVDFAVLEKAMNEAWAAYEKALLSFEAAINDMKASQRSHTDPVKALIPFFHKLDEGKERAMEALAHRANAREELEEAFQSLRQAITQPNENICPTVEEAWLQS
ncbi:MAG: hypothetical protein V1767_02470 [Chloroflexota bacterium]